MNHKELLLERIVPAYKFGRYETHRDLWARAEVIRGYLREYIAANPLDEGKQEKYCIVAHSRISTTLTSKGLDEEGQLIGGHKFKNCEMRAFNDY